MAAASEQGRALALAQVWALELAGVMAQAWAARSALGPALGWAPQLEVVTDSATAGRTDSATALAKGAAWAAELDPA